MIPFFYCTDMIYMHWVPTGQTVNKEYYVEFLREFRKRFHRKRPNTLEIGSVAFPPGHYTSPQLHPCHRLLSKMVIKTVPQPPFSPDLAPCDFCLFPKLRGCRYETIGGDERGCDRRSLTRSHKRTSMGSSRNCWNGTTSALQPEEITSKETRVSCVYYQ